MDRILQNKILKTILLFPLGFLFLMAFYIPGTNIPLYDIIMGIGFITAFLLFPKRIVNLFLKLSKLRHFKMLLLFTLWIIFVGILFVVRGKYPWNHFIYATFLLFLYNNYTWYLYPLILYPQIISEKDIIKFLYITLYLICLYGLISYTLQICGLGFLDIVQKIVLTRREEFDTARVLSVFEEPSHMGGFLCIVLPFVYKLSLSKYKIFKNNIFNVLIKKSFIPLVILTICFVQSPMWIIFFFIITAIYFSKKIFYSVKKHIVKVCSILIILLLLFTISVRAVDINSTFLNRITKVVGVLTNWDAIVLADGSFANRILSYGARARLWFEYPITGVGYKNAEYHVAEILTKKMNVAMPKSMKEALINKDGLVRINGSILWILLSDTGLVGFLLFYLFVILSIIKLNKITSYLPNCLPKDYITAVKYVYINVICLSIYGTNINTIYIWFFLGLTNVFTLYRTRYLIVKNNNQVYLNDADGNRNAEI